MLSSRVMTRHASTLAALALLAACGSEDHVIGRFTDPSCDDHADALVCSGFERPDLSEWGRVIVVNEARVEQTDARAFAGSGALHAESLGDESAAVVAREFEAVTGGELHLRAHLYVPDGLPTEAINVFFLGDVATPDPFRGVDFNLESGALSTYVPGQAPDRFTSTLLTIPRDTWFCLQIAMTLSPDAGTVTILVDGEVGLEQANMKTLPEAGVHLLRAGVDWSSLQVEPFDLYIDDLVLSTSAVDCG